MTEPTIRAVTAGDANALAALWGEVFPEYADPSRPQRDPRANIARKLAFGDGLFWLAEDRGDMTEGLMGSVIGSVMAGYDGHRGWIYALGVHPARRRQGLGRALLAHAERALASLGCAKINVQVLHAKSGSAAFWRAVGYEEDPVVSLGRRLTT